MILPVLTWSQEPKFCTDLFIFISDENFCTILVLKKYITVVRPQPKQQGNISDFSGLTQRWS